MIEVFYLDKGIKKAGIEYFHKGKQAPFWIDITNITKEESDTIGKEFNLHPLTAEDLSNSHVRVKVEEFNEYLFCVFYSIRKAKAIELVELDFVIGKDFVISNHKKPVPSFEELKKDPEKLKSLFSKGPDFLFHKLLDMEVDNYFPLLETIDDNIEKLEE